MLQLLEKEEENTCEIASTFTSLRHEVEAKTTKLKKMFARLQSVKQEIVDLQDEFSKDRSDMQQTQEDLTKYGAGDHGHLMKRALTIWIFTVIFQC